MAVLLWKQSNSAKFKNHKFLQDREKNIFLSLYFFFPHLSKACWIHVVMEEFSKEKLQDTVKR